ncbi:MULTISPECIES: class I SAM-dependent methyltransferase [unclassified Mesorhizobium]|uniref:class I SAM-dependent methyltransferase n=1 Tax=unclassified Mesorhizobium TaxID=325217 RepID=UPI0013DFE56C|nr:MULTISPECIES: class I SAM-dependent methyltransferase [unclassified Mesorhizobium]
MPGLRDTFRRLSSLPIDFEGKTVLDIGCSLGGFLFSLTGALRWGVGIDIDWRSINVCQKLKSMHSASNLDFYVHDIETQPLSLIEQFLPDPTVDIVFIMRIMGSHSLSKVLEYAAGISNVIVFEPIYSHAAREGDVEKLKSMFSSVKLSKLTFSNH